jgi:hypothetical protein
MGNWLLYIGIVLCCTGIGVIPGAVMIFCWGVLRITDKQECKQQVVYKTERSLPEGRMEFADEDKPLKGWKDRKHDNFGGSLHVEEFK